MSPALIKFPLVKNATERSSTWMGIFSGYSDRSTTSQKSYQRRNSELIQARCTRVGLPCGHRQEIFPRKIRRRGSHYAPMAIKSSSSTLSMRAVGSPYAINSGRHPWALGSSWWTWHLMKHRQICRRNRLRCKIWRKRHLDHNPAIHFGCTVLLAPMSNLLICWCL